MRKRAQTRKQVNHDDMWITVPGKAPAEPEEIAGGVMRTETPTYEDTWYQVLRKRDDDEVSDRPEEPAAEAEAPVDEAEPEEPEVVEETAEEAVEAAAEAAAPEDDEPGVPARPDLVPQHASSLD